MNPTAHFNLVEPNIKKNILKSGSPKDPSNASLHPSFTIPSTAPDCRDAYGHGTTQYFITSFLKQQADSDNVSVNSILLALPDRQGHCNSVKPITAGLKHSSALGVVTARVR